MAPGDCRIEWADGGLVRDRAATEAAIGEAVSRYVAARRGSGNNDPEARAMSDDDKVPLPELDGNADVVPRADEAPLAPDARIIRAAPPTSKRSSTCRCRSRPCSAAPAWMSASC